MPEAVLKAYNQLDAQSQNSVIDYINFLLSKVKPTVKEEKTTYNKKILALAGKIDIDEDAVNRLREISTL